MAPMTEDTAAALVAELKNLAQMLRAMALAIDALAKAQTSTTQP